MIQKTNSLVQGWVAVTDASGRTRLESRWFEASRSGRADARRPRRLTQHRPGNVDPPLAPHPGRGGGRRMSGPIPGHQE